MASSLCHSLVRQHKAEHEDETIAVALFCIKLIAALNKDPEGINIDNSFKNTIWQRQQKRK
ncbi:hypothetical protein BH11BAC6_BH11BAC6_14740 [soil metagenome]